MLTQRILFFLVGLLIVTSVFGQIGQLNLEVEGNGTISGGLGIGTTSPSGKLDVIGSVYNDGQITIINNPVARFYHPTNSGSWITVKNDQASMNLGIGNGGIPYIWSESGIFMIGSESAPTMFFSGMDNGNVGIGTNNTSGVKLNILTDNRFYGILTNNITTNHRSTGIYGSAEGTGVDFRIGVYGKAANSMGSKYGVYAISSVANGGTNYGVYGGVSGDNSTSSGKWAVYASGNFYHTGSFTSTSDARLKKKIKNVDSVLEKVMNLKPKTYEYKTDEYNYVNLAQGQQFGFLSQDVEKIFPNLVEEAEHSFFIHDDEIPLEKQEEKKLNIKSLSYISFIPILTKAIQEQQEIIEAKEERITTIEQENQQLNDRLDQLEKMVQQILSGKEKETKTEQVGYIESQPYLEQNQPNPFYQTTKIHYYVPKQSQQAQLQIATMDGKLLSTFVLQKGENAFTLDAKQLAAGTYIYTLLVDGRVMESKQMILTAYQNVVGEFTSQ